MIIENPEDVKQVRDADDKIVPAEFVKREDDWLVFRVNGVHKSNRHFWDAGETWWFELDGTSGAGLTLIPPAKPDLAALFAGMSDAERDEAQALLDAAKAKTVDPTDWEAAAKVFRDAFWEPGASHKDALHAAAEIIRDGWVRMPEIDARAIANATPSREVAVWEVLRQIDAFNAGDEA